MDLVYNRHALPLLKALSSETRLSILTMLQERPMSIVEISQKLGVSAAITSKHIASMEGLGIIRIVEEKGIRGTKKMCHPVMRKISFTFMNSQQEEKPAVARNRKIGSYDDCKILPKCGLYANKKLIGVENDSRYFNSPERESADVLWYQNGYVAYDFPCDAAALRELCFTWSMAVCTTKTSVKAGCAAKIYINDKLAACLSYTDPKPIVTDKIAFAVKHRPFELIINESQTVINGKPGENITIADIVKGDTISLKIHTEGNGETGALISLSGRGKSEKNAHIALTVWEKGGTAIEA